MEISKSDFAPEDDSKLSLDRPQNRHTYSWWQRKSIRFKATLLAIAIGTIPSFAVGSIGYYYAANSIEREAIDLRKTLVENLQTQVSVFMGDRLNDLEMMAQLSIFTNPSIRASTTVESQSAALQKIKDAYGIYSSIAVFDARGDLVAQTDGIVANNLDRDYIQAVITDGAIVNSPISISGVYSIYTASVIKDSVSKETIGFVRATMPVEVLQELLASYTKGGDRYYLLDRGEIFLDSEQYLAKISSHESALQQAYDYEAINFENIFEDTEILDSSSPATDIALNTQTNTEQFLTFAPLQRAIPSLNWQAIIATDTAKVFAPRRKLRRVFVIGVGIIALGVGAIAYILTHRLLRPVLLAARAVQKIGRGDFDTRLQITGTDEFALLGNDINRMAGQLSEFVEIQTLLGQHSESLKNIALKLSTTTEQLEIIELALTQTALVVNANRIIYYQFETECSGTVVAEFVAPGYPTVKGQEIFSIDRVREYYVEYQSNTEGKISDAIILANLDSVEPEQLFSEVNASLIAPVFIEDCLDGLLISANYTTRSSGVNAEMEFIASVAKQIGFAATRLKFIEQQKLAEIKEKSAREILQQRALNLLQEVYDVSHGDLTIRARVTEDEIGTIADSYNSTIESLQKLVNQTKSAAIEVQTNTVANDMAIQSLAQETLTQAAEIVQMRSRLAEMEQSIDLVSRQANQARDFIKQAGSTIVRTDRSMNQTVAEIDAVQDTVTQATAKAQKLGESSQAISQAVNTIGRFAAQTHLLALKASIEAARAGEQGRGFGVIAEEVRSLATQSAEASADIETLVNKIQLETSEVVIAMNYGSKQITQGSDLVQQTRQSLTEVNQKSDQINQLVDSITKAAEQQSMTSVRVSEAMNKVAAIAQNNSHSATQVSTSIKQLTAIALKLQTNIDKFRT